MPEHINHSPGVLAYAMYALADLLADTHLPAPLTVTFDRSADTVLVHVAVDDVDDWVAAVTIDRAYDETFTYNGRKSTHVYREGRLPLGVRVRIVTVEITPVLASVLAGVPA